MCHDSFFTNNMVDLMTYSSRAKKKRSCCHVRSAPFLSILGASACVRGLCVVSSVGCASADCPQRNTTTKKIKEGKLSVCRHRWASEEKYDITKKRRLLNRIRFFKRLFEKKNWSIVQGKKVLVNMQMFCGLVFVVRCSRLTDQNRHVSCIPCRGETCLSLRASGLLETHKESAT